MKKLVSIDLLLLDRGRDKCGRDICRDGELHNIAMIWFYFLSVIEVHNLCVVHTIASSPSYMTGGLNILGLESQTRGKATN